MLIKALEACAMIQRTYGKQAEFEKAAPVFLRVLSAYPPAKVIDAVGQWLLKSQEFPTIADILQILNPQPTFEKPIYIKLLDKAKNDGARMNEAEWNYIKQYEANAMRGL